MSHYNFICWKLSRSVISRPRSKEKTNALLVCEDQSQLAGIARNKTDGIARGKTKSRKGSKSRKLNTNPMKSVPSQLSHFFEPLSFPL